MLTVDFELMQIKDGEVVLDIGCGEGRHSWEVCKQWTCYIYGVDIDETSLKKAHYSFHLLDQKGELKGNWALLKADITRLPFRDGTFDKIICSEVLEHVRDDMSAIRELARVLKDEGILAISVPSYLPEVICWKLSRTYYDHPGGHVRVYKANELIAKLEQNNLGVFATRRKHALHSFYWILRCLFGVSNDRALLPSLYYKFLVWDIYHDSRPVRALETALDRFFSKSLVVYTRKAYTSNAAER
jgi:SAM-dependent methyltransferase